MNRILLIKILRNFVAVAWREPSLILSILLIPSNFFCSKVEEAE
jgi:hypothetical protein